MFRVWVPDPYLLCLSVFQRWAELTKDCMSTHWGQSIQFHLLHVGQFCPTVPLNLKLTLTSAWTLLTLQNPTNPNHHETMTKTHFFVMNICTSSSWQQHLVTVTMPNSHDRFPQHEVTVILCWLYKYPLTVFLLLGSWFCWLYGL